MSHVDDGALHAYLDGALDDLPAVEAQKIRAHLGQCEACLSRLEEERSLRAEARTILAGGTPDLGALPSFEEVRARAGRSAPPSPMSRLRRLGWAASVVVAAGTGWLLRGSQASRFTVPEPATVGADVVGSAARAADEAASSSTAFDDPVSSEGQVASGDGAVPGARAKVETAPAAAVETRQDRVANTAAVDEVVASSNTVTPPGAVVTADSAPAAIAAIQALAGRAVAEEKEAVRPSPVADVAGVVMPTARQRAETPSVAAASKVRQRVAESPALVGFADRGAMAVVPGLPVIPTAEVDPTLPLGAVRTLQRLRGDTLELIHLPESAGAPSLERRPGDDRTEVVIARSRGWLVGRARIPADSLLALLVRIPGGS